MATKTTKKTEEKAPKTIEVSTKIKTAYSDLSGSARDAMVYFVKESAIELEAGRVSVRVGRDSIKAAIKETGAISDIAPTSFDYFVTASAIFDLEGSIKATVKDILKVSAKLHRLHGADKALEVAKRAKDFSSLVDGVKTLEEAAKDAKEDAEADAEAPVLDAKAITLESVVDALDSYLKKQNLKDLKTAELQKLESVISRLVTVAKNTKAA